MTESSRTDSTVSLEEREPAPPASPRTHVVIYWVVGIVLAGLLVMMYAGYDAHRDSKAANQKAVKLVAAFDKAGLTPPEHIAQITRVLGDDGGPVCEMVGEDLPEAEWKAWHAVGGEIYVRPVRIDRETLQGLLLVVGIYCPDKLPDAQDFVDEFDFADTIRD